MAKVTAEEIIKQLGLLFPDAHCELDYQDNYQLTVAVILSAQTTDKAVNKVTPALFKKYPDAQSLSEGKLKDIEKHIGRLGLYASKAKAIQGAAKVMVEKYGGQVPNTMEGLMALPGVGRKCANVIMSEAYGVPSLAVDTHVARCAKRLGLAGADDPVLTIERKLKRKIPRKDWIKAHHRLIFFGRYMCHARYPDCQSCPFISFCRAKNDNHS